MKMNNANSFILKRILIISLAFCITQFFSNISYTVEPDEILQNKKQESRAREISKNIKYFLTTFSNIVQRTCFRVHSARYNTF